MSSWRLLLDRELHSQTAVPFTTFAFSSKRIKEFSRYDCNVEHAGCVNTATWSRDGNLLITGSDDRLVKIWRASGSFDCLKELYSCNTRHRGNIFCADFAPDSPNTIYSCAADGQLRCTKLDDGQGGRELYQSQDIIHGFIFDIDQPKVLYTAEEAGIITRHDLRVRAPEVVFANDCYGDEISIDNHQVTFQETFSRSLGSVKALTQSHAFGGQQLLVAGKGFKIGLLDLRLTNSSFSSIEGVSNRFHVENNFVKTWSPYYSYADAEHGEHESPVHYTCLSKNRERSRSGIYQSSSQVSASGMHVSGDGRSFVASYQGDQVYTFNMMSSQSQVGATSIIGGHINYATFIKSVRYFGPRDEYVLSGSDSGHVWIWNSSPKQPNSGRNCELVNVLLADGRTCNGAIPHPTAPVFASYGIDDDVKVWGYRGPVERDGEQVQSNYVEKIVAVLEDGSLLSTMPEKRSVPVKSDTRFAFCSHGGSDDRNRYDRVSFSTAEFSHSKSSHNSLGSLPTLLKKNEQSAHANISVVIRQAASARISDRNRHIHHGFYGSPRVVDANQYCATLRTIRDNIYSPLLRSYEEKIYKSSFYADSDVGNYFPEDCLEELLSSHEITYRNTHKQFSEGKLREELMPVLDGTSLVQFNQGLFTIFSSFYNLQKLRAEQKIGSINFLLCFLNGRWSSISELVAVPILRMLEIAYIAKQNGNAAFKKGHSEIAHYFYSKAIRYVEKITEIRMLAKKDESEEDDEVVCHRPWSLLTGRASSGSMMDRLAALRRILVGSDSRDAETDIVRDVDSESADSSDEDFYDSGGVSEDASIYDSILESEEENVIGTEGISDANNEEAEDINVAEEDSFLSAESLIDSDPEYFYDPEVTDRQSFQEEDQMFMMDGLRQSSSDISGDQYSLLDIRRRLNESVMSVETSDSTDDVSPRWKILRTSTPMYATGKQYGPAFTEEQSNFSQNTYATNSCGFDNFDAMSVATDKSGSMSVSTSMNAACTAPTLSVPILATKANIQNPSAFVTPDSTTRSASGKTDTASLSTSATTSAASSALSVSPNLTKVVALMAKQNSRGEIYLKHDSDRSETLSDMKVSYSMDEFYDYDAAIEVSPVIAQKIQDVICSTIAPVLYRALMNNLIATFMQMEKYPDALSVSREAFERLKTLGLDPDAKLYFRRGSVFLIMKDFENALKDFNSAIVLSPNDLLIGAQLKEAKRLHDAKRKRESKVYSKLFA